MEQNFGIQPDFAIAAHALQTAGNELAKCSNLPAIQEGNAILAALQALSTQVQTLSTQVQTLSTQQQTLSAQVQASEVRLSAQFKTLSDRVLAIEHNSSARLQNSLLRLSTAPLIGLHDSENNPIEPFPETSAEIQRLGGAQVDEVLLALKMPNSGTIEQRRSRLRVVCGLRTEGLIA